MPRPVTIADPRNAVNTVLHPLTPRILTVSRVEVVGPAMIRVALTGDRAGAIPFLPYAANDHVKLVLPTESGELAVPTMSADGRADWSVTRGDVRDYTVRSVDAEADELIVDGVVHLHGPAGRWFAHASVGDRVGVVGPRGSHIYPPGYEHYILLGDETALPAIGRWLDEPGLNARVTVITIAAEVDYYPLPEPRAAEVSPHHLVLPLGPERGDAAAEHLRVALQTSPTPESVFVFAGGETGMLRPLRRVLKELGHPRHALHVDGYWRQGTVGLDHHAADDDD